MQARYHVAASAVASAATFAASDSAIMAAAAFLSGVFIDADHMIDYIFMNRPPYSFRRMTDIYYNNRLTRVFLLLHSWELLALLALAAVATGWQPFLTGLLIGMGHHLLLDQLFNDPHPLGYCLSYRLYNRLSYSRCFRRPAGPLQSETEG